MQNLLTPESFKYPSKELLCYLKDIICELDCHRYEEPPKPEVDVSKDEGNDLILGSDLLPFYTEPVYTFGDFRVEGGSLKIDLKKGENIVDTKSVEMSNLCGVCPQATLTDNGDGTYTFRNASGETTTFYTGNVQSSYGNENVSFVNINT